LLHLSGHLLIATKYFMTNWYWRIPFDKLRNIVLDFFIINYKNIGIFYNCTFQCPALCIRHKNNMKIRPTLFMRHTHSPLSSVIYWLQVTAWSNTSLEQHTMQVGRLTLCARGTIWRHLTLTSLTSPSPTTVCCVGHRVYCARHQFTVRQLASKWPVLCRVGR